MDLKISEPNALTHTLDKQINQNSANFVRFYVRLFLFIVFFQTISFFFKLNFVLFFFSSEFSSVASRRRTISMISMLLLFNVFFCQILVIISMCRRCRSPVNWLWLKPIWKEPKNVLNSVKSTV